MFGSGWVITPSWLFGSYDSFIPSFSRNLHTVLLSGCISLYSSSARGFPFLHTLSSIYCLYIFWWWPFWFMCVDGYLIVVLVCITLIMSNVEHLLMCLLVISVSLEKCLFRSYPIFYLVIYFHIYWAAWAVHVFWKLIPCWLLCLQIVSPVLRIVLVFVCLWLPLLCKSF